MSEPRKILIVEDEPALSEVLKVVLKGAGYKVECEHNGASAVQRAARWQPELLILDVTLPGLDGWQVLSAVRAHPKTRSAKVLMCTEKKQMADLLQAAEGGAEGYFPKPVDLGRLVQKVRELLPLQ